MSLPDRLGRLRKADRLGAGGFATVWLFHDDELDSPVAVKALADNWAQRLDVRDRFLEEARILRRADSDHVVRVYDIGETPTGTPYFVMTYADRGSLATLTDAGAPVPLDRVAELVGQAGSGLTVLHDLGVVHRDIKPQNLLLRSSSIGPDRLLVADLGVAKALLQASGLTQVVGTPAYMAPEQATGEGIDVRADVHALGAVAYVLLTGRTVRADGLAGLLSPTLPPAPSSLADLPVAVDDVVLRAVAPAAEDRWPDVASFTRELARVAAQRTRLDERPAVRERVAAGVRTRSASEDNPALMGERPSTRRGTGQPAGEAGAGPATASAGGMTPRLWLAAVLVLAVSFAAAYVATLALR